jgi:hypothetical protein
MTVTPGMPGSDGGLQDKAGQRQQRHAAKQQAGELAFVWKWGPVLTQDMSLHRGVLQYASMRLK